MMPIPMNFIYFLTLDFVRDRFSFQLSNLMLFLLQQNILNSIILNDMQIVLVVALEVPLLRCT